MPIHIEKFIEVLAELCKEKGLKAAVCGSLKGGLIAGSCAVLGGLLLGPIGLALGGAAGGGVAAVSSRNSFQSVAVVLYNMKPHQKQVLYNKVKNAFLDFGIQDAVAIIPLIASSTALQELALRELSNFMRNELNLAIRL